MNNQNLYPYGQYNYTQSYSTMPAQPINNMNFLQRPMNQNQTTNNYQIVPVANIDEIKAMPTDFNGGTILGVDKGNKAIYSKYLDLATGLSRTDTYKLIEIVPENEAKDIPPQENPIDKIFSRLSDIENKVDALFPKSTTKIQEVKK